MMPKLRIAHMNKIATVVDRDGQTDSLITFKPGDSSLPGCSKDLVRQ